MIRYTRTGLAIAGLAALASALAAVSAQAQRRQGYSYTSGQDIYTHVCQGCHMPDARGAAGASAGYPALAENRKLTARLYPVTVIVRGLRAMPSFADLNDAQVAAVTNYVRSSFGNNYTDPVTPEQVKAARPPAVQQGNQRPG